MGRNIIVGIFTLGWCLVLLQYFTLWNGEASSVQVESAKWFEKNDHGDSRIATRTTGVVLNEDRATEKIAGINIVDATKATNNDITSKDANQWSCKAILQKVHEWNDCWRHHVHSHLHNGGGSGGKILCSTTDGQTAMGDAPTTSMEIGAPLYQYAYFGGQGFGRVIEHTVKACLLAFALKRPCLIDVSPRDPHYTWRSFITQNTYEWEPKVLFHPGLNYSKQLGELIHALPHMSAGDWDVENISLSYYESANYSGLVFPMHQQFNKSKWRDALSYYHGTHPNHGNKIMLSPNWATAWHTKIPLRDILDMQYNCTYSEIGTLMQNALYGPSDLTWYLHEERFSKATKTVGNTSAKAKIPEEQKKSWTPTMSAQQSTIPYGSIHLRTYFMNNYHIGNHHHKKALTGEEVADMLYPCMERVTLWYCNNTDVTSSSPIAWWLLADNVTVAKQVSEEIHRRQQKEKPQTRINVFHDYGSSEMGLPSKHSNSKLCTGLYQQAEMAGSIQDWMVLHQAQVTIVYKSGAYGNTGARGNGKVFVETCGPFLLYAKKFVV